MDVFLDRCLKRLDHFSARKMIEIERHWMPFWNVPWCDWLHLLIAKESEIDRNWTFLDVFLDRYLQRLDNFSARKMIEIERLWMSFWNVAWRDWWHLLFAKESEIDRNWTFSDAFLDRCLMRLDNLSAMKMIAIERFCMPFWNVAWSGWIFLVIEKL